MKDTAAGKAVFGREPQTIERCVAVIATGGQQYTPTEYGYGTDPRVITHLELDRRFMEHDPNLKGLNTAVFIQCVGSREPERPYCSRVCEYAVPPHVERGSERQPGRAREAATPCPWTLLPRGVTMAENPHGRRRRCVPSHRGERI